MDADPKFDALVGRDLSVALDHRPLDFNGAVHRVDDTPELDNCAVAGALDDAAVVHGDGRIDQVAAERPQPRQNPVLVGSGKPRIADDVGHQDRRELSSLAHGASRRDRVSRFGSSGKASGASQRREDVDHRLGHGCTSMLHGRDVEAGVQPRVSTGRSIHAVPSITPSPREGIEDGPRLRPDRACRTGR